MDLVRATSENEHCMNVTSEIFSKRFASQRFHFSTEDHPDSLGILKYFGRAIESSTFYFAHNEECDPSTTSKYRELLKYADRYARSVKDFEVMGGICGLNLFVEIQFGFSSAEVVFIHQRNLESKGIYQQNLCEVFPNVRNLQLNIGSDDIESFINCEFYSLDELTVGGAVLDKKLDETFKSFLIKNSRIQHISFISPTRRRTFELVKIILRNLQHVSIFDKVLDDDVENEIFIPGVRKLEISFGSDSECELPLGITFGGDELQELSLNCNLTGKHYKYINTLYRYPNIKSLNLCIENYLRLSEITGKFPLLTEASFTHLYADDNDVAKFIEKCDQLRKVNFLFGNGRTAWDTQVYLEKTFGIISVTPDPHNKLRFEWNKPNPVNSANSKFVKSGFMCLLIVMHISRELFV